MPSETSEPLPVHDSHPAADLDRQYRLLRLAVDACGGGFRLIVATYINPRLRDELTERLITDQWQRQMHISRMDLSSEERPILLSAVKEHLAALPMPRGWRRAVMVTGLDSHLDYSPAAKDGFAVLETANLHRDAFSVDCPVPLVLWLSPSATTALGQRAPDLWHWRVAVLDFTGGPTERERLIGTLLEQPWFQTSSLSTDRKLERIAALRDLIVEIEMLQSGDSDSKSLRGRRTRIEYELGSALMQLGDYPEARAHYERARSEFALAGNRKAEANTWHQLATIDLNEGNYPAAREQFGKALTMRQAIGDRAGEAATFYQIGATAWRLGKTDLGIRLVGICFVIQSGIGSGGARETMVQGLGPMATALGLDRAGFDAMLQDAADHYRRDRGAAWVRLAFEGV
jgi:tetratricopeptide (TPR) repeat protein